MADHNFTLKNPTKFYIWSIKSRSNFRTIMLTDKLSPKDFHFQVGQFIASNISEMKLIGEKFIYDHWGTEQEEIFFNKNKFMKQSIIDDYNEIYHNC
jgi:hypothetical protein